MLLNFSKQISVIQIMFFNFSKQFIVIQIISLNFSKQISVVIMWCRSSYTTFQNKSVLWSSDADHVSQLFSHNIQLLLLLPLLGGQLWNRGFGVLFNVKITRVPLYIFNHLVVGDSFIGFYNLWISDLKENCLNVYLENSWKCLSGN